MTPAEEVQQIMKYLKVHIHCDNCDSQIEELKIRLAEISAQEKNAIARLKRSIEAYETVPSKKLWELIKRRTEKLGVEYLIAKLKPFK